MISTTYLGSTVNDIRSSGCGPDGPRVNEFCLVGVQKAMKNRSVKVCFNSNEDVKSLELRTVFIAPDRSQKERTQKRELL